MKRLLAVLFAATFAIGITAGPALACHDRYYYHDRYGYPDDDCDGDGYYCDGYGYYESSDPGYRYHRRYYYDDGACVYHAQVGAISVDFLCRY